MQERDAHRRLAKYESHPTRVSRSGTYTALNCPAGREVGYLYPSNVKNTLWGNDGQFQGKLGDMVHTDTKLGCIVSYCILMQ